MEGAELVFYVDPTLKPEKVTYNHCLPLNYANIMPDRKYIVLIHDKSMLHRIKHVGFKKC